MAIVYKLTNEAGIKIVSEQLDKITAALSGQGFSKGVLRYLWNKALALR